MCNLSQVVLEKGIEQGEMLNLIKIVCRKIVKGDDANVIADDLDEDIDLIKAICEVAKDKSLNYDARKILEKMNKTPVK